MSVLLLVLVLGWTVPAQAAAPLEEKVQEFRLDNGLTLLVVERHSAPTFTAYMTIGVGSVDEQENNRGIAHLLEHMRFKGTQTIGTLDYVAEQSLLHQIDETVTQLTTCRQQVPFCPQREQELVERLQSLQQEHRCLLVKDEFSRIYARHGGVGFNAFTGKDLTTYQVSLPANRLELWVSLEADRMRNAVLREFYTEKEVIQEERRRSYESKPSGMLYEALLSTAFRVHPYRHPVIGWHSDIAALTKEQTADFLHRYYTPVNTTIALVGDVEAGQARALVERYFGDIAPGERVPAVTAVEPTQNGERRAQVLFDAESQFLVAWHKPTLPDVDDYAFDLLGLLLTQGPTSRLYRTLVLEQKLATSIEAYGAPGARYSNLFVLQITPRVPHTVAEVEQALYRELELVKTEALEPADLERARKRLRADRLRHLQTDRGMAGMLTHFQVVAGDWRYLAQYDSQIARLTAADLQQAASRWLTAQNRTVIELVREVH
ncbi:MAG: insulinase family protein [Desulfuromonadaceae bacterium]|nr:insulinase family protein [Desulfuromonadaceae bacterium]